MKTVAIMAIRFLLIGSPTLKNQLPVESYHRESLELRRSDRSCTRDKTFSGIPRIQLARLL
jgi:hypothetical protein